MTPQEKINKNTEINKKAVNQHRRDAKFIFSKYNMSLSDRSKLIFLIGAISSGRLRIKANIEQNKTLGNSKGKLAK